MKTSQILFCFQNPTHLCTKFRNRMSSETASMLIGKESVSVEALMKLTYRKSKSEHGLDKTNTGPKDWKNSKSCLKLASDDVISSFEDVEDSQATRVYLLLLRSIALDYIERNISAIDRIYHSWLAVFLEPAWLNGYVVRYVSTRYCV